MKTLMTSTALALAITMTSLSPASASVEKKPQTKEYAESQCNASKKASKQVKGKTKTNDEGNFKTAYFERDTM